MLPALSDLAALAASIALVVLYRLFLRSRARKDPQYTLGDVNAVVRAHWVRVMMETPGNEVLAVQTLRNSVMTASFMASTAILLMVGTLTLVGTLEPDGGIWHALNISGEVDERIVTLKLVLLLVDFFVAFFCFAMAVRFYNHVGYMISAPDAAFEVLGPHQVTAYLDRAGSFYAFGIRAFFFCVPLVFWLFGPHLMVIATLALLLALYPFDRAAQA